MIIKLKLLKRPQWQSLVKEEVRPYKEDVLVGVDILIAYIARE